MYTCFLKKVLKIRIQNEFLFLLIIAYMFSSCYLDRINSVANCDRHVFEKSNNCFLTSWSKEPLRNVRVFIEKNRPHEQSKLAEACRSLPKIPEESALLLTPWTCACEVLERVRGNELFERTGSRK